MVDAARGAQVLHHPVEENGRMALDRRITLDAGIELSQKLKQRARCLMLSHFQGYHSDNGIVTRLMIKQIFAIARITLTQ